MGVNHQIPEGGSKDLTPYMIDPSRLKPLGSEQLRVIFPYRCEKP